MTTIVTRFAPSPNGPLHLGHAYAAIVAHDLAVEVGGELLLRIEDIDGPRSKPEFAVQFREDLAWLGLTWREVPAQSTRLARYEEVAQQLKEMGLLYPCQCTRKEIAEAATERDPDGAPVYAGTCKGKGIDPAGAAWRLDVDAAVERVGELRWTDQLAGEQIATPQDFGDIVLLRKDLPASYHLAATIDDADDGITLVTRGADLFAATHIHRLLQALLELPVPHWHHHDLLIEDATGTKLAKRRGSASLADLRSPSGNAVGSASGNRGADGELIKQQLRLQNFPAGISLGKA